MGGLVGVDLTRCWVLTEQDHALEAVVFREEAGEHWERFFGAVLFIARNEHDSPGGSRTITSGVNQPAGILLGGLLGGSRLVHGYTGGEERDYS